MYPNVNAEIVLNVRKFVKAYEQKVKPLCQEMQMPQTALDILLFLANNPEYKTARDIVEIRGIKANLVSVNVDKLVMEGYLERQPVQGDRRKVLLVCTEKSLPVIEKGRKIQGEFYEGMFEGIDLETREQFGKVVKKFSMNFERMMKESE